MHYRGTIVWQKAVEMVREIYHLTRGCPNRDLWNALADHAGSGFHSTECGRGMDPGIAQGKSAVLRDCAWVIVRTGNARDDLRTTWMVPGSRNPKASVYDDEHSRMLTTMRRNHRAA